MLQEYIRVYEYNLSQGCSEIYCGEDRGGGQNVLAKLCHRFAYKWPGNVKIYVIEI